MLHVNSTPLGMHPFAQRNKCIWPAVIAAAGSILGGLIAGTGTSSAASSQLQATRETNQTNKEIAQENNKFNAEQIDKMNAYNSAVAQRARLEEAGLNPNLMMSGGNAGTATTSAQADTTGKAVAPDIGSTIASGYQTLGNSINSAAQQISQQVYQQNLQDAQVSKLNSEREQVDIDNLTRSVQNQAMIDNLKNQSKHYNELWKNLSITNQIATASMSDMIKRYSLENRQIESQTSVNDAQASLLRIQSEIQQENLRWLPQEKRAGLAQTLAETEMIIASKHLNEAEAVNAYASASESYCRQQGIQVDNEVKRDTKEFAKEIVRLNVSSNQTYLDKQIQDYSDSQKGLNPLWRWLGISGSSAGSAAAGAAAGALTFGKGKLFMPKKVKGFSHR